VVWTAGLCLCTKVSEGSSRLATQQGHFLSPCPCPFGQRPDRK
jgi:hypothetical protein